MPSIQERRHRLELVGKWLDRQRQYRYRLAGDHELDPYLKAVAVGALLAVRQRLGFKIEVWPVVEARPGDRGVIWEDANPLYGFCLPDGIEVYVNFTRCRTPRRVVECIAHESWHLGYDAPHHPGENPELHQCAYFARAVADGLGY